MDADIFVSVKKKLRIQKYPDTCGRGLIQFLYKLDFIILLIIMQGNVVLLINEYDHRMLLTVST